MSKVSFSLTLDSDNYSKLKEYSQKNNISCGKIINLLIEDFNADTKIVFQNAISPMQKRIVCEMDEKEEKVGGAI